MRTQSSILFAAAAALVLAACTEPMPPPARTAAAPQYAAASQAGPSTLELIELDIDAGLLDREHGNRYRQYAVSDPARLPVKYRSSSVAKDATLSMVRLALDWDQLSAATQQEILDLRARGFANLKDTYQTTHFVLHYTLIGKDAVPAYDGNGNGLPDYIEVAAASVEQVWNAEVTRLGYPAPVGTPAQRFHIYFQTLSYYGYSSPENVVLQAISPVPLGTASAYIVIENDFYGFPPNDVDRTGQETIRRGALEVTVAHEFMHAIQFAINVYQGGWLMESHATWAEDAVYDGVNDWHWYMPYFLATPDYPIFARYAYGSAFFVHWLTETYGTDTARQIWFAARTSTAADAVRDVAFGGSWEAMKQFAPTEYLLDIADYTSRTVSVVPEPHNWIRATWDTYPVSVVVPPSAKRLANRAPWGLGANFIDFLPPAGSTGTITLGFDGEDGYAWRAFAVATPATGGPPVVTEIPLDAGSAGSIGINGLGTRFAKLTLVPTIADRAGAEVPFSYSATLAVK
ncbi:MAG: hypothetical protein FIB01_07055 [Gemmatimonadetes bacterium]|nr:hypothetical protein [Gemmatimonadota bacterium]